MKFTLALLSGLIVTSVTGLAIPNPNPAPEAAALAEPEAISEPEAFAESEAFAEPEPVLAITERSSDATIIKVAALGWAASVKTVSNFIDACANKKFTSQAAYFAAAKIAYAAELAEYAFKETLSDYLSKNQGCQAANSTLSDNDNWENVKNLLLELTELDWVADQDQIQQIIQEINFGDGSSQGRCSTILPAFDVYFTAATKLFRKLKPSDRSLNALSALVPRSCSAGSKRDIVEAGMEIFEA